MKLACPDVSAALRAEAILPGHKTLAVLVVERRSLPPKDIARALGFNSVYHFSNTFKAVTGIRPSEYRQTSQTALPETQK